MKSIKLFSAETRAGQTVDSKKQSVGFIKNPKGLHCFPSLASVVSS